ncbi:keratin-associated protein 9-1-like [Mytilus californianus]|uniref:keratin-associated protein 9-1-like n=1 Tax=Mytilus californianus TaxID=6549 RepID=UPI00224711D1|nr:keratin-associated protein 9-1-like [Mytilus californianus]
MRMWIAGILILCVIHCAHAQEPRHGVCPTNSCNRIGVKSNCQVDSDCKKRNQKCCRNQRGKLACTNPITGDRGGCPLCGNGECPLCIQYQQLCNADKDCNPGELCCYNNSCGTSCETKQAR